MDFVDPRKWRRHTIRLYIGYGLIIVALLLATTVLLFSAYGYGLEKGQVIQNGLVFVSSDPSPAKIYLNGALNSATTNSRLQLPAGQYTLKLTRAGYRPWVRALGVEGGSVERFDYPFLFPTKLVTTNVQAYPSQPNLLLQSPNRQWLLVNKTSNLNDFWEYNLNNQKNLASTLVTVSVPVGILTPNKPTTSWHLVDWSTDNIHVILQRLFQGGSEYILLDRQNPAASINLTTVLHLNPTTIPSFDNNKYDSYYLFDSTAGTLDTATLSNPQPVPTLTSVLNYKTYGSNVILYATAAGAPAGKVRVIVRDGSTDYIIRTEPADTTYLLNLTQYSGNWYVVAGATSDNRVYVYENPMAELSSAPNQPLVPINILKVNQPNYIDFSNSAQFIVAENGASFATYDVMNEKSYNYTIPTAPPAGQHATWMDGDRLMFVSNGRMEVFDYDGANQQVLQPALNGSTPFFDQNFKWLYSLAPATAPSVADQFDLTSTAMRIPADQ